VINLILLCYEEVKILNGDDNMNELNEKEIMILEVIKHKICMDGFSPSIRELCKLSGIKSTATMHSKLCELERKGFIEKHNKMPRTLRICKDY
jgi:SOS-response transcriptional repressor LexA